MEKLSETFKLLQDTNPQAADKVFDTIVSNIKDADAKRRMTPNSTLEFIENAILILGANKELDLSELISDMGIDSPTYPVWQNETEEIDLQLRKLILHPEHEGEDRIEFVYQYYVWEDAEEFNIPEETTYNEEDECIELRLFGSSLDTEQQNFAVYLIVNCVQASLDDGGYYFDKRDYEILINGSDYILSFEPSIIAPKEGTSLIIRKNHYPKSCYAYKVFGSYIDAMEERDKIFWDFVFGNTELYYDDSPSNYCTFNLDIALKQSIVNYMNENKPNTKS